MASVTDWVTWIIGGTATVVATDRVSSLAGVDLVKVIADGLGSFLGYIGDELAAGLLAAIGALPAVPPIDWTPFNNAIGVVNSFLPVAIIVSVVSLYLAWCMAYSIVRIILKIIWSG